MNADTTITLASDPIKAPLPSAPLSRRAVVRMDRPAKYSEQGRIYSTWWIARDYGDGTWFPRLPFRSLRKALKHLSVTAYP